jgi:hypothetical protein
MRLEPTDHLSAGAWRFLLATHCGDISVHDDIWLIRRGDRRKATLLSAKSSLGQSAFVEVVVVSDGWFVD